ncbi:hypothetical protein [Stygiolobus caldivivus]|uniref:Uncharacterized protein n=1 Tax=Stygiolobus caldivivus TaxID=2824673 RepID=A0A8D5U709_9CREN|nr:hypothetical protein [Stygiolobus caldivivus]BCU70489.1 hypothetical protein KN1_17860 [Stygiolobus caldivivus]
MVKKVAIRISDPKKYHEMLRKLRERGIKVSEEGEIVITDNDINDLPLDVLIGKIICKIRGKEYFNELLIGIDTNKERLSIAIIGDGELIESRTSNVIDINDELSDIISSYPHKSLKIGVGGGNKIGELVYRIIKIKFSQAKIVNESKSSSPNNPFVQIKDRDIRAAYIIALRSAL